MRTPQRVQPLGHEMKGNRKMPTTETKDTPTRVATYVKTLRGFTGVARLYRCDPPMYGNTHVIVSATVATYSGPETYIFPATDDGDIADWGELNGSFRGALDHEAALKGAGYEVVS